MKHDKIKEAIDSLEEVVNFQNAHIDICSVDNERVLIANEDGAIAYSLELLKSTISFDGIKKVDKQYLGKGGEETLSKILVVFEKKDVIKFKDIVKVSSKTKIYAITLVIVFLILFYVIVNKIISWL
jgi:hypothetical protein